MIKNEEKRYRTHMYSTKISHLPGHLALDKIDDYLEQNMPKGTDYAWIIHDKDVYTIEHEKLDATCIAGTPKDSHIHLALCFPNPKTTRAVSKLLKVEENMIQKFANQGKSNQNGAKQNLFSYLVHLTEGSKADGKWEYKFDEVHANFDYESYVRGVKSAIAKNGIDKDMILEQIMSGQLRMLDFIMDERYTNFYIHNKSFVDTCISTRYKKLINDRSDLHKVEVYYVEGQAGSGKSTFARRFAEKNYGDYCISSSANDAVQDYLGQNVMIFDDARPNDFKAADWLKMLDPYNNQSTITSRFYNKYLAVKCIILTSTTPFEEFFVWAKDKGTVEEPVSQFMRRFKGVVKVEGKETAGVKYADVKIYEVEACPEYQRMYGTSVHNQFSVKYNYRLSDKPVYTDTFTIGGSNDKIESEEFEKFKV